MNKVVYNDCYGGFGLSEKAIDWLISKGIKEDNIDVLERHHPLLVECVETLGSKASNDRYSLLKIALISEPIYRIQEYDGIEQVITTSSDGWIVIK